MLAAMISRRTSRRARQVDFHPSVEQLEERLCLAIGPMSIGEQHLHELLNWIRANPSAAAQRYATPLNEGLPAGTITTAAKPPLARNDLLRAAMTGHLQDLQKNNLWSHTGSNGSTFAERIRSAGYAPYRRVGENLAFWGVTSGSLPETRELAAKLVETWFKSPGHRKNLMDPDFREVGTAMITGPFRYEGTNYTAGLGGQDFGKRDVDSFLTGVGCRSKRTDFSICDVTTAISGATVTATRLSDGLVRTTATSTTGGYDLQLPDGVWDVRIVGGGLPEPVEITGLSMAGENLKRDFQPVMANRWVNTANPLDVNNDRTVSPQDALVVINDLNAKGSRNLPYITSPPPFFLDVNRDWVLSPADALQIINHLNSRSGEGESVLSGWIAMQRNTLDAPADTRVAQPAESLEYGAPAAEAARTCPGADAYVAALDVLFSRLEEDETPAPFDWLLVFGRNLSSWVTCSELPDAQAG